MQINILEILFQNITVNIRECIKEKIKQCRRVTRGGKEGEVSPALFQKLEKSALIWGKIP